MEEAVVTGMLQPTGRKVVRYKHTKDIETGESRLALKGALTEKEAGPFPAGFEHVSVERVLWSSDHCRPMKRTLLQSK